MEPLDSTCSISKELDIYEFEGEEPQETEELVLAKVRRAMMNLDMKARRMIGGMDGRTC